MGHFAKDCPTWRPAVVQTVQANPDELFCTSCGQTGHLGVISDHFSESVQDVRKKCDAHRNKMKADSEEGAEESSSRRWYRKNSA